MSQFSDFAYFFLSILWEGAPFILLGTLLSGIIDVYLPAGAMEKLLPRHKGAAVFVAGLLGAILPVCECAVVPVIRRLLGKGLPFACALTYMLAAPILNPVTLLSTYKAFGGDWLLTSSRMFLGYGVAVFVGLLAMRMPLNWLLRPDLLRRITRQNAPAAAAEGGSCNHEHAHDESCSSHDHDHHHQHGDACSGHDHHHEHDHGTCDGHHHEHDQPARASKIVRAMRSAQQDFIDVAVYFVIGVAITTLFNLYVNPDSEQIRAIANNEFQGTALLMGLAFVLSLCSTSDAFIAVTLHHFTNGAKLAFLVFGPMMDVKLIFLYQTVLRRKAILGLALLLFILIGVVTIIWQRAVLAA